MHRIQGTHKDTIGQHIAGFFSKSICKDVYEPYSAIGWIDNDNKLVGAAIFNNYTGANIQLHMYLPNKTTKKVIKDIIRYVFVQLKCCRLTVKVEGDDKKLFQLLPRIGFEYEVTQKDYFEGPLDATVYKLTKNNAMKWL